MDDPLASGLRLTRSIRSVPVRRRVAPCVETWVPGRKILSGHWGFRGHARDIHRDFTNYSGEYIYSTYVIYIYIRISYIYIYNTYHIPNWGRSWKAIENHCVQRSCSTKFHDFWTEHLQEPLFLSVKAIVSGFDVPVIRWETMLLLMDMNGDRSDRYLDSGWPPQTVAMPEPDFWSGIRCTGNFWRT